jgi:hypothetical protein
MGLVLIIIVIPGLICIAVSGVSVFIAYISTSAIKNKEAREILRAFLYVGVVGLSVYALSKGVFSPKLGPWH